MGTRMFDSSITDRLRRLPASAVTAYFYINLDADDDGVCQDVEVALAGTISTQEDIDQLVDKRFLIRHPEEPERVIVTHWLVHNNIAKSRKRKTANEDFLELLELKGNVYRLKSGSPKPEPELVQEPPKEEPKPEPVREKPKKEPKEPAKDRIDEVFDQLVDAYKGYQDWQAPTKEEIKEARKLFRDYVTESGRSPGAVAGLAIKKARDYFEAEESAGIQWSMPEMLDEVMGDTG